MTELRRLAAIVSADVSGYSPAPDIVDSAEGEGRGLGLKVEAPLRLGPGLLLLVPAAV